MAFKEESSQKMSNNAAVVAKNKHSRLLSNIAGWNNGGPSEKLNSPAFRPRPLVTRTKENEKETRKLALRFRVKASRFRPRSIIRYILT